jgi:hypothetical protein
VLTLTCRFQDAIKTARRGAAPRILSARSRAGLAAAQWDEIEKSWLFDYPLIFSTFFNLITFES